MWSFLIMGPKPSDILVGFQVYPFFSVKAFDELYFKLYIISYCTEPLNFPVDSHVTLA